MNQTTLSLKSMRHRHLNASSIFSGNTNNNNNGKLYFVMKEIMSIKDADFSPSTIACNEDYLYVGERPKNVIRVYDRLLRLIRVISLNGLVVSSHRALAVGQNVGVLMDGSDGLALFNSPNSSSFSGNPLLTGGGRKSAVSESSRVNPKVNVCHFYSSPGCLEDVKVVAESRSKSSVLVADSCANDIKEFSYEKGGESNRSGTQQQQPRISLTRRFGIESGVPISVVSNQLGVLFVLTDLPQKIYILDQKKCDAVRSII